MDIWEFLDRDVSDAGSDAGEETPVIKQEPISYEIFLKSLANHPFIKKFNPSLPTAEQAHRDFQRILNAQKFRVWVLRHRAVGAEAESEFENAPS
tara:strand:- start:632 stop:916 length:285 start_codon:yes stop_codon:yes gene_type:complete